MITVNADNLPRFMVCDGSINMPPSYPVEETDDTARAEGIAAHHMANAVFRNDATLEELVDRKAPNGVYMSAEMAQHVATYLEALNCGETEVETSFSGPGFEVPARADHISFSNGVLNVDDLKYGHRLVEPDENWTLIAHAIGFCINRQIQPTRIMFTIHQPRAYHADGPTRSWGLDYAGLMERFTALVERMTNPPNTLVSSREHCAKCHARATCPAARAAGYNAIDVSTRVFSDDMPNDALSDELDTLFYAQETINKRVDALKELALHRLKNGQVIDNYASEDRYGHYKWVEGLTGEALTLVTGKDMFKRDLITPAEAKTRGVPEHVVKSLTTRPRIGKKLTRVSATKRAERLLGTK